MASVGISEGSKSKSPLEAALDETIGAIHHSSDTAPPDQEGADGGMAPDDINSKPGNSGGVLGFLTCRRRAASAPSPYRNLILQGRGIPMQEKELLKPMAHWTDAHSTQGARVFLLAPRGQGDDPKGYLDMWKLLCYAISEMHEHVVMQSKPFAVVWMQWNDHRISSWSYRSFKRSLDESFGKNMEALHVVHPSWTTSLLCLSFIPITTDNFWQKFRIHQRIKGLEEFFDLEALALPACQYEHDKYLDRLEAAQMKEMLGREAINTRALPGTF